MGYVKLREKHLALLVANLPKKNMVEKNPEEYLNPCQMGTHLTALNESYPMNTNMTGFGHFSFPLDESSLSIRMVEP